MRVGLITPGSIADAAWNSAAYQGLQRIRDSLDVQISHVEARTPAEQAEALPPGRVEPGEEVLEEAGSPP